MSHPSKRISQQELESYLWGAAVLLRGLIDAGDYKQFIFPLLFYKRVSDVWEEEYQAAQANSMGDLSYAQFAENHRFQIPQGAHWNEVRQTPKNVGAAIQKAMRAIESANPDLLDGIFGLILGVALIPVATRLIGPAIAAVTGKKKAAH